MIFVPESREKSSHKIPLIPASSSIVKTSSIFGCIGKSTAAIA
jgi:hypothetical protein